MYDRGLQNVNAVPAYLPTYLSTQIRKWVTKYSNYQVPKLIPFLGERPDTPTDIHAKYPERIHEAE